jgi:hypothetical protein
MALRQAGYCESCEWMTAVQVMRELLTTRMTLLAYERRGEWRVVRSRWNPLYHRADVEQAKQKRLSRSRLFPS